MKNIIQLPINIAPSRGAYSIELMIGTEKQTVELLLDTGSSTIVFKETHYCLNSDKALQLTPYAQCVTYGKGGWAGPVVQSTVTYNDGNNHFEVDNAPFALVENQMTDSFLGTDGILGLAYHHLNHAYDMTEYYQSSHSEQKNSYPWLFSDQVKESGMKKFKRFLKKYPEKDITPLFTVFEEENVGMNKFSLLTHRAIVYAPNKDMTQQQLKNEPLNQGLFIIGDVEHNHELFSGKTLDVKVLHDAYYNTNLLSVRVEGFNDFKAPPLDAQHLDTFFSNAIIDSGSSYLVLQSRIYDYVMDCFNKINPQFGKMITAFYQAREKNQPYSDKDLNVQQWPNLYFTFEAPDQDQVTLCCDASHYWQTHALTPNQAFFTLMNQLPKWPDQSILGLPLMSQYLCIFDRSARNNAQGIIKFAEKK